MLIEQLHGETSMQVGSKIRRVLEMKTRGIVTRKRAADQLTKIRRENVKRHNESAARTKLREDQVRAQRVASMQLELDRMHAAAIRGTGLDNVRINRMNVLKELIGKA